MGVAAKAAGKRTLLTETELALYLRVNVKTLGKWRARKYGPRSYRFGRAIRYELGEVEDWIIDQAQSEAKEEPTGITGERRTLALPAESERPRVQREYRFGGYSTKRKRRAATQGGGETKAAFGREEDAADVLPIQ